MPAPYNELNALVWAGYAIAAVSLIETLVMATHIVLMRGQRGRSPLPFVLPLILSGVVTVGVITGALWTGARHQTIMRDTLLILSFHSYTRHVIDVLISSTAQVARVALIWEGFAVIIMAALVARWLMLSKRRQRTSVASL